MLDLERILRSDCLLRAMTGLNRKAFEALLPSFTAAYEKRRYERAKTSFSTFCCTANAIPPST